MPDYANGKIYKIVNTENDKVYIGSTTMALAQRIKAHRYCAKTNRSKFYKAMRWHGIENFSIVLIKSVSCSSKSELENVEYKITNKLKSAGVKLYNVRFDGKLSDRQIIRTSGSNSPNYGKRGAATYHFKRGCIYFKTTTHMWQFIWQSGDRPRTKSFSVNKYGHDKAKRLAEEYREKIYPIE